MDPTFWQIMVLAVVQGATEFLPVSSSGHLVIVAALLTGEAGTSQLEIPDLNIVLHGGTLAAILVYYWHRIWRLLGQDRRTVGLLLVATLPAVAVGVPLKKYGEAWLSDPLLAGALLPVTGLMLLVSRRIPRGKSGYQELSYRQSLAIGCSQAVAILPGLSRSGTTITAGLQSGLTPAAAATFSFLLAIPAIGGACLLEVISGLSGGEPLQTPAWHLALGALVSFLVGLACLIWLLRWIERGRLHYFAWWCIPAGLAVVFWQLWGPT